MRADTGMGGGSFNITMLGLIIVNLPFIICDFIFANQPGCAHDHIPGLFHLATWLRVDAWSRIIIVGLFVLVAILNVVKKDLAAKLLTCTMNLLMVYTVFQLIWLILGAIIFWGHLHKHHAWDGGINAYMWIVLILGFISLILHCWSRKNHH